MFCVLLSSSRSTLTPWTASAGDSDSQVHGLTSPWTVLVLQIQCDGELLPGVVRVHIRVYETEAQVCMMRVWKSTVYSEVNGRRTSAQSSPSATSNLSPMHFSNSFISALSSSSLAPSPPRSINCNLSSLTSCRSS